MPAESQNTPRPVFQISLFWLLGLVTAVAIALGLGIPVVQFFELQRELEARGDSTTVTWSRGLPSFLYVNLDTNPETFPFERVAPRMAPGGWLNLDQRRLSDKHFGRLEGLTPGANVDLYHLPQIGEEGAAHLAKLPYGILRITSPNLTVYRWESMAKLPAERQFVLSVPPEEVEPVLEAFRETGASMLVLRAGEWTVNHPFRLDFSRVLRREVRLGKPGPLLYADFRLQGACLHEEEVERLGERFAQANGVTVTLPSLTKESARQVAAIPNLIVANVRILDKEVAPETLKEFVASRIHALTIVMPTLRVEHVAALAGANHMHRTIVLAGPHDGTWPETDPELPGFRLRKRIFIVSETGTAYNVVVLIEGEAKDGEQDSDWYS